MGKYDEAIWMVVSFLQKIEGTVKIFLCAYTRHMFTDYLHACTSIVVVVEVDSLQQPWLFFFFLVNFDDQV